MPRPRKQKRGAASHPVIDEEVKISVTMSLKHFKMDETATEFPFPSSFTSEQRAYVHLMAIEYSLKTKSRGKGPNRYVTVFKREGSTIMQQDANLHLCDSSMAEIGDLVMRCPVTQKERQEIMPYIDRDNADLRRIEPNKRETGNKIVGRLHTGTANVPPLPSAPMHLQKCREELPIWSMKEDILSLINNNQVVIISGETGSGKTTQVPQFILEQSQTIARPVRIICAQPRRISAVSVSERVAAERGEEVGYIVGYQIRLESRISPCSLLTYCTYGVLMRLLMSGDSALSSVTHVIIDEVHERDRHCDFLLLVLRDILARCRSLRLVLMSATVDTSLFAGYYRGAAVISVPGRLYDVQEYYLEDILKSTGYMNKKMGSFKEDFKKRQEQVKSLEKWGQGKAVTAKLAKSSERPLMPPPTTGSDRLLVEKNNLDRWLMDDFNETMEDAWVEGSDDSFNKLVYLFRSHNVSVDFRHTFTSATALMIAAARGNLDWVEKFLNMGADANICASNGYTAFDWAQERGFKDVVDLLQSYSSGNEQAISRDDTSLKNVQISEEDRELLEAYQHSINDDHVDLNLLMCLLSQIHSSNQEGAVLIFLPGYDDIVEMQDRINENIKLRTMGPFRLFILHSSMQTSDQRQVFRPPPPGERKIILSTNIAETSITIDDVVFVIDSGKVKEKSFDSTSGVCMLRSMWVSKACAQQRRGRAGRTQPGICYHVFSRIRYNSLQKYQTPEILRLPLQELCLQTKMLAPFNTSIADFLAKAIEPPPSLITRNAVNLLKLMDALTPCEDLTDLGTHLIDLPIEPRLGKALLFAVVLRCLDPVLTIICTLAHREPFNIPSFPGQKRAACESRKKLAAGTYSDHMALLRAFQLWQEARTKNSTRRFSEEFFVSTATLEMVMGMRSQILGQLRASSFVKTRGQNDMYELNMNSDNWAVVKAALTAGMYPNLARVDRECQQLRTQSETRVTLHPSSALRETPSEDYPTVLKAHQAMVEKMPTDWLLFEEMSRHGRTCLLRTCTVVSPITVFLFAGSSHMAYDPQFDGEAEEARTKLAQELESDSEAEDTPSGSTTMLKLDEWALFRVSPDKARAAVQLRQKLHSLFIRRLRSPGKPSTQADDLTLRCVVNVLTSEERALQLPQCPGVGQKPKSFDIQPARSFNSNDYGANNLDRQAKLMSPLEACSNKNSDSGSNLSSESPSLSPTLSYEDSTNGDLYPPTTSDIRYFVIKNGNLPIVQESASTGQWTFSNATLRRLVRAQKEGKTVVLIFSVQRSGGFQGYARLGREELTGNPYVRYIEWIKMAEVPFQASRHLLNPWHDSQRVQHSRDGQELEPSVGENLCYLWDRVPPHRQFNIPAPTAIAPFPGVLHPMMDTGMPSSSSTPQYGRPIRGSYGFMGQGGPYSPNQNGGRPHQMMDARGKFGPKLRK